MYADISLCLTENDSNRCCRKLNAFTLAMAMICLAACGSKEKPASQSLVVVNGQEITVHQINDELMRSNVQIPPEQKELASKQLLESLIDRQLLQGQAVKDKIDRDPAVMQAIERSKSQIVAQAYLQKRLAANAKPTKDEIQAYFNQHPEIFAQRKIFNMSQLIIAKNDFSNELKILIGESKSLDDISTWFTVHKVEFVRNKMVKNSSEMPLELVAKLQGMKKGQLMVVEEGDRSVLVTVNDVKEVPVTLEIAEPQIGQFLLDQSIKLASLAELARLRSDAKIEYLTPIKGMATPDPDTKSATASTAMNLIGKNSGDALKRGIAGL
ncbi:EpsD family peptidyl-prolyl cis-trans isomerase [Undibacterium sp. Ren11W]|uniref:EpsD family peptidyl-prolyl cis-trans isomerase n=1 Tax=Undibacterium sp. Ren11W TaxID=3413045 RepID=UPI003BF18284